MAQLHEIEPPQQRIVRLQLVLQQLVRMARQRRRLRWRVLVFSVFAFAVVLTLFILKNKIHRLDKRFRSWQLMSGRDDLFPFVARNVPLGESYGLVLETQPISIRGVADAYNPSIIAYKDHYLLVFRYDQFYAHSPWPHSYIGCVELDKGFQQMDKEFVTVKTESVHAEDPRIFKIGEKYYLSFSDILVSPQGTILGSKMRVASFNPEEKMIEEETLIDPHWARDEKNWIFFDYLGQMHAVYCLYPMTVLTLPRDFQGSMLDAKDLTTFNSFSPLDRHYASYHWRWGKLSGGTPPIRVGSVYLGFFHSFLLEHNTRTYFIGAYTFEDHPPFRITAISPYPILFQGMFSSPPSGSGMAKLRCIYPSGIVTERRGEKTLLHIVCGENDSSIKVITLDQEVLLKNLKRIAP